MYKAAKHHAPDTEDQKVNSIERYDMGSRADICCDGNNWRIISMTG